jgi:prephenate dehydrogenase
VNATSTSVRLAQKSVRIVGTGLLGSSIGLALRPRGVDVILTDSSPSSARLAEDLGAGRLAAPGDAPDLVVVCVPPDVIANVIQRELEEFPDAVVTDVASVKVAPRDHLREHGVDLARYVGGHPLAGRERGGAVSARGDLFLGRPWVVCREPGNSTESVRLVEDLIHDLGASVIEMSADDHDRAVALVSHAPQIVSTLMAAQLTSATDAQVRIAGQGVRDVTRIAASSPDLWVQILGANAHAVVEVLRGVHTDLGAVIDSLDALDSSGSRSTLAQTISRGNEGVSRLPGKHGQNRTFSSVTVLIDDRPGQLANLLVDIGELAINLEDLNLEHAPGAQMGTVEFSVVPEAVDRLVVDLEQRGWRVAR